MNEEDDDEEHSIDKEDIFGTKNFGRDMNRIQDYDDEKPKDWMSKQELQELEEIYKELKAGDWDQDQSKMPLDDLLEK